MVFFLLLLFNSSFFNVVATYTCYITVKEFVYNGKVAWFRFVIGHKRQFQCTEIYLVSFLECLDVYLFPEHKLKSLNAWMLSCYISLASITVVFHLESPVMHCFYAPILKHMVEVHKKLVA
jgi:hypothetical protein